VATVLPELVSYLEALPEPHILFDRQYRILAANAAYRRQFSPAHSVVGRHCYEVSHQFSVPCDQAGESCPMARALQSRQRERVLHLHHTPQGEAYVNIELVPLNDASGQLSYFTEKMVPLRVAQGQPAAQGLVGRAPVFQAMLELVARVAPSTASVLLLGESGTGKELVARAVHEASPRASAPLVVVDCASLPEALFESELFGHERGAFTGANVRTQGLVESASGGTLFLDEVGDIPLALQVKLLRLLESGTYRRVGSTTLHRADVRVVSATHRDLTQRVAQGLFREDLYYRLCTFPIRLPALRERLDDLPVLCVALLALLARLAPERRLSLSGEALQALHQHDFPGNVRELRNVLELAAVLTDGLVIGPQAVLRALGAAVRTAVPAQPLVAAPAAPAAPAASAASVSTSQATAPQPAAAPALTPGSLREVELATLQAQLQAHQGSRAALAAKLGISERSLYRKLRALAPPKA
jgi:DNA-binding NtrC family response regulator